MSLADTRARAKARSLKKAGAKPTYESLYCAAHSAIVNRESLRDGQIIAAAERSQRINARALGNNLRRLGLAKEASEAEKELAL